MGFANFRLCVAVSLVDQKAGDVLGSGLGFLRRDRGQWRRTVRSSELLTGAHVELQ
jgi:hypothetical protein